ncbi:LysE family translocator [Paenibacillus sp. SGZ-1009]|uniref:LysE family translocator n=1 Tax=Paenibacillus campi TaxID=3106031 RepID=UPI002AFF7FDD|nr:LysE family transporter [Paenibacillus sp. SGZ-1009]
MPIFSFWAFILIASFTPGPNNMMAMAYANRYGLRPTLPFCFGVGTGFGLLLLLCSLGNLLLIQSLPLLRLPLTLLGVAYMLYLAYQMIADAGAAPAATPDYQPKLFCIGLLIQFLNPKGILFSLSTVSTFILPYYSFLLSYLGFAVLLGLVGICSSFSWSLGGALFQTWLQRHRRLFNWTMALLLVSTAVMLII